MPVQPGDVEITLNGEAHTLRCTLRAAKTVNAYFGDYPTAFRKIGELGQDAFFVVIAAGLNKKVNEVEEAVYSTGLPPLVDPLLEYIGLLANGGKPVQEEGTAPVGES
jgi:hypothetical protein